MTGPRPAGSSGRAPRAAWRICVAVVLMSVAMTGCARQGQDMTDRSTFGNPAAAPLATAVAAGDAARAKTLIAGGASVDAVDDRGTPLLQWAMQQQDRGAFRLLLDLGADPARGARNGQTAVHLAAMGRQTDWLEILLDRGVSPDLPNTVHGAPPIFDALRARNGKNVDVLLKAGARLDAADRSGTTPLHQAALVNDPASALKFLEAGADPRATDRNGATFQDFLYDGDPKMLNGPTKRDLEGIRAFLRAKGIPVKGD